MLLSHLFDLLDKLNKYDKLYQPNRTKKANGFQQNKGAIFG
jgi:hypothetical protein